MNGSGTNSKIPFRKNDLSLIIFFIIALLIVNSVLNLLLGQSYKKYAKFNINNISTFIWNNGKSDKNANRNEDFIFPINTNKHLVYSNTTVK